MCLISKQKQSIKRDPSDIKNSLIIRRTVAKAGVDTPLEEIQGLNEMAVRVDC